MKMEKSEDDIHHPFLFRVQVVSSIYPFVTESGFLGKTCICNSQFSHYLSKFSSQKCRYMHRSFQFQSCINQICKCKLDTATMDKPHIFVFRHYSPINHNNHGLCITQ